MSKWGASLCAAGISFLALPAISAERSLNPPKASAKAGEQITLRQVPGFQARCFKESTVRERGKWTDPETSNSDYVTNVEERNGVQYVAVAFQQGPESLKVLLELDGQGGLRKVPPLLETNIPNFEKEFGPLLTRLVSGMSSGYLGQTFEVGKDYGPLMNLCRSWGAKSEGSPKGTTVLDGTLTHAGRPSFLVTQTYEQACQENGVRFSVAGSVWAVHDLVSGLVVSSAGKFDLFAQGSRFRQSEEFVECGISERN